MHRRGGYTLIETAIVLAILAILAILAVPEFKKWTYHIKFTGFVRDVFTEFQQGRQRALASGIAHEVVVDAAGDSVVLRRGTDNAAVRQAVKAPGGIDIVSGSSVTFNANGTASSAGNVNIRNLGSAADASTITVTLGTGRVKIQ